MSDEDIPQLISAENEDDFDRVPVTVVTGFLGAGKTTLINFVLTAAHGKRIAVILNDFGEGSAVESTVSLKDKSDGMFEEWIELRNGCLCCSLKDPGVKAIENLMKKRGRFDYVMLETTGLADPGPIAALFWMDKSLCSQLALDGMVTILDAKYCLNTLSQHNDDETLSVCERQIALADVLILNKVDLISDHEKQEIVMTIRGINDTAKIIETQFSEVDLSEILNLNLYSSDRIFEDLKSSFLPSKTHLDQTITTVTIERSFGLYRKKFENFIEDLLWEKKIVNDKNLVMDLMRVKGIIQFLNEEYPCSIQCVNELYDIFTVSSTAAVKLGRIGIRLIFIGRNLHEPTLAKCIEECSHFE